MSADRTAPPSPPSRRRRAMLAAAALLTLPAAGRAQSAATPPSRAQVLVLGTYHMANPGLDYANMEADDVRTPKRQQELEALAARLAAWKPTKIAVEVLPARDSMVQARYAQWRAGGMRDQRGELYQVAFRLADRLGHARVYPIDFKQDLDVGGVFAFAAGHGQQALADSAQLAVRQMMARAQTALRTKTVTEILRETNTPAVDSLHAFYLQAVRIGADSTYPGADMTAAWYARNLKIFANLTRITEPGDRVLVLFGSGHRPLLREFVAQSGLYQLAETDELLR